MPNASQLYFVHNHTTKTVTKPEFITLLHLSVYAHPCSISANAPKYAQACMLHHFKYPIASGTSQPNRLKRHNHDHCTSMVRRIPQPSRHSIYATLPLTPYMYATHAKNAHKTPPFPSIFPLFSLPPPCSHRTPTRSTQPHTPLQRIKNHKNQRRTRNRPRNCNPTPPIQSPDTISPPNRPPFIPEPFLSLRCGRGGGLCLHT